MSKKIVLLFLSIYCSVSYAQVKEDISSLNAFKYATVYSLEEKTKIEKYLELVSFFEQNQLIAKGYFLLKWPKDFDDNKLPRDYRMNPCLLLTWQMGYSCIDKRGASTWQMILSAADCNDKTIFYNRITFKGSRRLNAEETFRKAIRKAFEPVMSFNYKFNESLSNELYIPKVEITTETEESLRKYFDENQLDPIEGIYKTVDKGNYYKIGIKKRSEKYIAVVIESNVSYWKSGEVKAYFDLPSASNIYTGTHLSAVKRKDEVFTELDDKILKIKLNNITVEYLKIYPVN